MIVTFLQENVVGDFDFFAWNKFNQGSETKNSPSGEKKNRTNEIDCLL